MVLGGVKKSRRRRTIALPAHATTEPAGGFIERPSLTRVCAPRAPRGAHDQGMSFDCFAYDGALCFFNGTCAIDLATNLSACTCEPGYGPDNTIFHSNNCALPDQAFTWYLVEMSILYVPMFTALGFEAFQATTHVALYTIMWTILTSIFGYFFVLSQYLQRGMYEGGLFFIAACLYGATQVGRRVALAVLGNVTKLSTEQSVWIKRAAAWIPRIMAAYNLTILILLMATCRTPQFNFVMRISIWTMLGINSAICVALVAHVIFVLRKIQSLKVALQQQDNTVKRKWNQIIRSLRVFLIGAVVCSVLFFLGLAPLPILYQIFDSVPFQWVLGLLMAHCFLAGQALVVMFIRRRSADSSRDGAPQPKPIMNTRAFGKRLGLKSSMAMSDAVSIVRFSSPLQRSKGSTNHSRPVSKTNAAVDLDRTTELPPPDF